MDYQVNLSEALKCTFKSGWKGKFFGVLLLYIPICIFTFSIILMQQKMPQSRDMMAFFIINTVMTIVSFILYGYFLLYAHDRGLNKNAQLRELGDCLPDAFFAGLKWMLGYSINVFLVMLITLPLWVLFIFLNIIPILGTILSIILYIALFIFTINFIFKLNNHFLKDLRLISWFQWKLALKYNKDCHFGKLQIFLAILILFGIGILTAILFAIIYLPPILSKQTVLLPILLLIFGPLLVLSQFFSMNFMYNIFGQYTYNTIYINTGITPEKIPNIINQDKVPTLVIAGIIFFFQLGMSLLAMNAPTSTMNNPMMNGVPSSTNKMNNIEQKFKKHKKYTCSYTNELGISIIADYIPGEGVIRNCEDSFLYESFEEKEQCKKDNKIIEQMYQEGKCEEIK